MNDILTQVWNCLVQSSQIYVNRVVNSSSKTNEQYESEGIHFALNFQGSFMLTNLNLYIGSIKRKWRVWKIWFINYSSSFWFSKRKAVTKWSSRKPSTSFATTPFFTCKLLTIKCVFVNNVTRDSTKIRLYISFSFEKIENWSDNPEQFVQDEDEESYSYSVRIAGQELIDVRLKLSLRVTFGVWKCV